MSTDMMALAEALGLSLSELEQLLDYDAGMPLIGRSVSLRRPGALPLPEAPPRREYHRRWQAMNRERYNRYHWQRRNPERPADEHEDYKRGRVSSVVLAEMAREAEALRQLWK